MTLSAIFSKAGKDIEIFDMMFLLEILRATTYLTHKNPARCRVCEIHPNIQT